MQVNFYTLSKRPNSTLRPTGSGTVLNVNLKAPCSVQNPVLLIDTGDYANAPAFNYAYIGEFSRYYFISELISDGRLWEVHCSCDVLATFKTAIGNFSGYVLRSASAYNGKITDGAYPGISQYTVDGQSSVVFGSTARASTPWQQSISDGFFVLGMLSQSGSLGSIKYVALDPANMQALCTALANNSINTTNGFQAIIDSIGEAMTKQLVDPLQYIKTAVWLPLPYSIFATLPTETSLNTGYLTFSNLQFKDITTMLYWGSLLAYPINNHPQVSRGSYLNNAPYTERYFFAPPFGMLPVNAENIQDFDYIAVNYRVDFVTGKADITLYGTDDPQLNNVNLSNNLISRASGSVGLSISMVQAVSDYLGMVSGITQTASGILSMSPAEIGGGLLNTVTARLPRITSTGGTGGLAGIAGTWRLYSVFNHIASEHLSDIGRPLCEVRTLGSLSGYMQVRSGDIPLNGTAEEQAAVRAFLESGFFYE